MKKFLLGLIVGLSLIAGTAYALSTFQVPQGGTGAVTLTGCLSGNGTGAITGSGSPCSSGGSGGGTFSTSTSGVPGQLFNYPNNTTDIVIFGGTSTSTGQWWFDPNTNRALLGNSNTASTTIMGNVRFPSISQGFAYLGSGGLLSTIATSSISLSGFTNDLAALTATNATLSFSGSYNGSTARTVGLNLGNANTWTVNQTFNYSSSTVYSSFVTASTTNLIVNGSSFNNLLGTGLANSAGALTVSSVPNSALQNSTISGIALGSNLADLTATNGTLTFSGAYNGGTARTIGLNLGNANAWTALQQFQANASTTMLSVYGGAYIGSVGGNATTTILGTATSTFGAGVSASYLNITGTSATSTFARGIDLAQGCFSIAGTCVGGGGGGSGTVTSVAMTVPSGFTISGTPVTTSGTLALGVSFPSNGIITANAAGTGLVATTSQLTVGSILSTTTANSTFVGSVGIASTTPFVALSVGAGTASSTIAVAQYEYGKGSNMATSTSMTLDARTSSTQIVPIGTSAVTLTICNMIGGQHLMVQVMNPNATAGALTIATCSPYQLYWVNKTVPTQTTTANDWDWYSFTASEIDSPATTTKGFLISAAQTPNF